MVFTPDESKEETFNTAIDDTSDDPTIVMGKPVTTAFVSDDVHIPTEKVGCLQVTSQLQEFLNHFPPEFIEKAFEQIYQILQVLDAYLIDNPQYYIPPDSEYISLIMYATKLEIDLCNFLAIWAVLSILLDTIEKYRSHTPKTPDEVNTMGMGKNTNTDGQKGIEKEKPPHKKATKASQIKTSQNKGDKANKGKLDTLLGDPTVNTKVYTHKAKEKGQKDKVGINDIGIFEFIFHGLPNPPDLEGMDEDRLRELQNAVQEQLHQRDKERERNITRRVQEFEKTFDFVNSHLLKGVATMAELTKTDNRQPIGKIKPTDKMVMMPSLFDGTKPAMSKQHYKRFNLYINFQTKSGHLTDPVGEAIDLFKHTLDKTALVWFQMNRSKFKDLTTLKMILLQRYNPWGKTKREQLQSWNILSFDPKNTHIDEQIDLINTLGDM